MPSTFSKNLRIELPSDGSLSGLWGRVTNRNLGSLIEQAITGSFVHNVGDGDISLSSLNGIIDQARNAVLIFEGTSASPITANIPDIPKKYTIINRSDNTVIIQSSASFYVPYKSEAYIYNDGNGSINGKVIANGAQTLLANQAPFHNPNFSGTVLAPTPAFGSINNQVATTEFVANALPIGSVIMWYGASNSLPYGFQVCDGNNGTPDLRDKFVVGAGGGYALGDSGGANEVTLTTEQIPAHKHTGNTQDQSVEHTHGVQLSTSDDGLHLHDGTATTDLTNTDHTHSGTTASNNRGHTHTFSDQTRSAGDHNHSGSTNTTGNHTHQYFSTWTGNPTAGTGEDFRYMGAGSNPRRSANHNDPHRSSTDGNHFHSLSTNTTGEHTHSFSGTTQNQSQEHEHDFSTGGMSQNASHDHNINFKTDQNGTHKHNVSGDTGGASGTSHNHAFTTDNEGGSGSHENRPPYVALFYIMKVA